MMSRSTQRITRRAVLGTGLFLGTSWALKSCASAPNGDATADGGESSPEGGATAGELVVASFPGTTDSLYREKLAAIVDQETGIKVSAIPLLAFEQVARLKASPDNPPFDVVILDDGQNDIALREGLIQAFPADKSQNLADVEPSFIDSQGLAPIFYAQGAVLGYNPERITTPPTSWDALFDPNLGGRIGLVSMNSVLGTSFMVELAKLRGGSESEIEPAFVALREILSNVNGVAANPGALLTLFQQGEIDIAPMWHNDVMNLKARGLPIEMGLPESGIIAARYSLNVVSQPVAGIDRAVAYVDTMLGKAAQSAVVGDPYFYIPANSAAEFPAEFEEIMGVSSIADFMAKANTLDWATINQQRSAWIEQFNREIQV
ncbi:ABC transporter substrate-binding protein [filamentous cyanobacterium CCP1]|nr:ABC transporter substrate-binding protein [filamentous cyanobacterium CCP2]PSB60147.1 ABC transporter substrate-binding protein [filamentous cyanobacterium CCP1]